MGLMTSVLVGAAGGAAESGAKAFYQEQRALIDRERVAFELEMKEKYATANRERIAGVMANAQGGPTDNAATARAKSSDAAAVESRGEGGSDGSQQDARKPATRQQMVDTLIRSGDLEAAKNLAATDKTTSWQDVMLARIAAGKDSTERRATATEKAAETRAEAVRDAAETRADATREAAETKAGSLTKMEVIRNREIDLARQKIADLTEEDIKRKTQKFTNTGRINDEYDEALARRVTVANRRKAGEDSWFDSQLKQLDAQTNAPAMKMRSGDEILREFATDSAMKARGYKMGKKTDEGYEVLDAKGNVVGHYR